MLVSRPKHDTGASLAVTEEPLQANPLNRIECILGTLPGHKNMHNSNDRITRYSNWRQLVIIIMK